MRVPECFQRLVLPVAGFWQKLDEVSGLKEAVEGTGSRVLVVGVNPELVELVAARWPEAEVVVIDKDPAQVELARRRFAEGKVKVREEDVLAVVKPTEARGFDLVMAYNLIHFVGGERLLRAVAGRVKPGGKLVCSVPYPYRLSAGANKIAIEGGLRAGGEWQYGLMSRLWVWTKCLE